MAKRGADRPAALRSIEQVDPKLRESLAVLARGATPATHVAVAANYWRLRVYDAAYTHYDDAVRLDKKDAAALEGRARVWRQWGLNTWALSDVHRSLFYEPKNPEALNTLGTILQQAGQCVEARTAYAAALRLKPDADWARENLGRLICVGTTNQRSHVDDQITSRAITSTTQSKR